MSAKKFSELRADLYERSPDSRDRVAKKVAQLTDELGLAELRTRVRCTQAQIAELIGTSQSGVSRLERQHDVLVSTLQDYVRATGGRLRIIADYPEAEYEIHVPAIRQRRESVPQPRSFRVIWQNIRTRQLVHVGQLDCDGNRFSFKYTADAELNPDFETFPAFPDYRETYESDQLFPYFANRALSAARPDYSNHLEALGLTKEQATPIELLARSWGSSSHDTIKIVPEPLKLDGIEVMLFLVSGVRHADEDDPNGVGERVANLREGQPLDLWDEPDNPYNDRAIRLATDGQPVGWVPDHLLDYVHKSREGGKHVHVTVEHANGADRPWHLRLLCRLSVEPSV